MCEKSSFPKWFPRQLLWMIVCIICWVQSAMASTEVNSLVIDSAAAQIALSTATYVFDDPSGKLTIDDVLKPEYAHRFQLGSSSPGLTPSAYWVRMTVINPTDQTLVRWFDTGNRTLQEVDLYVVDAQGGTTRQSTGSTRRFGERPLATSTFVFPVTLAAGQHSEFYLRVRSTGYLGISTVLRLWHSEAYEAQDKQDKLIWSVILGVALALFVINVMLYVSLKDISYILYALSLVSIVWSASSSVGGFGPAYEYFWPNLPLLEQSMWVLAILPSSIFPILFVIHVLDFRKIYPKLRAFTLICMSLLAICVCVQITGTLLQILGSTRTLQFVYFLGTLAWTFLYSGVIWGTLKEFKRGSRATKYIIIGFSPVMLSTLVLGVQHNLGLPMSWHFSLAAGAWEWFVLALLLADRFSQEVKAKIGAQSALVQTLQRSEQALEQQVIQRTRELTHEQARTKELLHNILPDNIAKELLTTGITKPIRHESATVMFTDFAGFTRAVSTMPADQIVAELNEVFAAFDDICDAEGVEKIKTIGDAYMAAAGVSVACVNHAQRAVRAGLRMVAFVEQRNADSAFKWRVRVGIHSGPVIAGVVGKRKFAFDIWGDTVNIASRMESSGEAGKVNVSAYSYHLIRKDFACEYRGQVDAKGKGEVDMYFVAGSLV
jgi:class 3 adenylate cyclase